MLSRFQLLGLPINRSESFNLLAEDQCSGDMNALVNDMNTFFQSVSAHLTPINNSVQQELISCDHLIISLKEVELKLMSTNIEKVTGPDDLPDWILRVISCTIDLFHIVRYCFLNNALSLCGSYDCT